MKTLTEYQKNGYQFRIIERIGNYAIAQGDKDGCASPTFEVIAIQSHDGMSIAGKQIEPAEYAPSNAQWGSQGWTYQNMEQAKEKLEELTNQ